MAKKTTKATKTTNGNEMAPGKIEKFDLGAFRAKFDGLKDHASKLPEGKPKAAILTGIEDTYFDAVKWMKGIETQPVSA